VKERQALLVDIGSTYTKVVVINLDEVEIVAQGKSVTTVEKDVTLGLERALEAAGVGRDSLSSFRLRLACSSAAGGLSLVAIGLVPELTAEAARRAALGAGAVVRRVYSHQLTPQEVAEIEALAPDIILLAGGTDGGEAKTIVHNAVMLAGSSLRVPVVVAGNKAVGGRVLDILRWHGVDARLTENVMPRLNVLNVEPAQQAIRQVFLERIVEAKGLDRAEALLDAVAMPTPSAVLTGACLLADGLTDDEEPGWGELMVVDVGGATTDVHSVAEGGPTRANVVYRGLPEPRLKRTVEGDLGLRVSAPSLLAALGEARVRRAMGGKVPQELVALVKRWSQEVGYLPQMEEEWALELALGRGAVELAVARHVGRLEQLPTPRGLMFVQRGKDLSEVGIVVGTGGIFAHHPLAATVLQGAVADERDPFLLAPRQPQLYLDRRYILWAAGLLADYEPRVALRLMKRYLIAIETAPPPTRPSGLPRKGRPCAFGWPASAQSGRSDRHAPLLSPWSGRHAPLLSPWSGRRASLLSLWSGRRASLLSLWSGRHALFRSPAAERLRSH